VKRSANSTEKFH